MNWGDPPRFAIGTLTRVPVSPPRALTPTVAGWGLALGPLVGVALGLVSGLPLLLGDPTGPMRLLTAVLAVALAAWLTRGLHWDGLADLADGLGSGADRRRALAIMRQSDIGPFGVLTLALTVLIQVAALASLPAGRPAVAGWVLALAMGRLAIALVAGPWSHPARPDGLGAMVAGSVRGGSLVLAAATSGVVLAVAVFVLAIHPLAQLVVVPVATVLVALVITRLAGRLGGITGDVLGASAESAVAAVLVVLALI